MPHTIATHSGPFHADDVMAVALLKTFWEVDASVVRTRDTAAIAAADVVVDVGGSFDPSTKRFDHHQAAYTGPRSSAGMVLDWLDHTGALSSTFAGALREGLMEYLDAVDNGRVAPKSDVPCFPRIVEALNHTAIDPSGFDTAFDRAVDFARAYLDGLVAGQRKSEQAREVVLAAMQDAVSEKRNVIFLDAYQPWKKPYFANGGESHPTEFVLFPGTDGSWRIVAIPPSLGDFAQKRSFPEPWAGLTDEALEAVVGVAGAVFCHKNRFIAVFKTREGAVEALSRHGLMNR